MRSAPRHIDRSNLGSIDFGTSMTRVVARHASGPVVGSFRPLGLDLHPSAWRYVAIDRPPDLREAVPELGSERADLVLGLPAGATNGDDALAGDATRKRMP